MLPDPSLPPPDPAAIKAALSDLRRQREALIERMEIAGRRVQADAEAKSLRRSLADPSSSEAGSPSLPKPRGL